MSFSKDTRKPRVLAIAIDRFAIRQLRLEMPLFNLKRHGLIEDYLITDYSFQDLPDDYLFDTVWVQREIDQKAFTLLEDLFENSYVYDIDDLLIRLPTYSMCRHDHKGEDQCAITKVLDECKVLTCSDKRLVAMLERYTSSSLSQKAIICPNGFEFSRALRKPEQPAGLVWTSSDFPALVQSREAILKAIRKFSEKYDLPVYCFGHFKDPMAMQIRNLVELGPVQYFHHKTLLGAFPPLIGVAPLETQADQSDLDFINSKSDLKMVEFGGFGHPSVYSNAEPYVDTDLRCGVITPNDESTRFDAMESIYREKWKDLDKEQAGVVEARNMDMLAGKCWYKAIQKAQMDRLFMGSDVKDKVNGPKRPRPKGPAISWNEYDTAYYVWKEYKKERIRRDQALMIIGNRCGVGLFFLLYPLYKLVKPFRKLKRFFEK